MHQIRLTEVVEAAGKQLHRQGVSCAFLIRQHVLTALEVVHRANDMRMRPCQQESVWHLLVGPRKDNTSTAGRPKSCRRSIQPSSWQLWATSTACQAHLLKLPLYLYPVLTSAHILVWGMSLSDASELLA